MNFSEPAKKQIESVSRKIALSALLAVQRGAFAEKAIDDELSKTAVSQKDRALITELVYGVTRNRTLLDHIISSFLKKPTKKISLILRSILRMGIYQVLQLDKIPPRAAVNEATLQARRLLTPTMAGMVNGLLRKVCADKVSLLRHPVDGLDELSNYYSHPKWLVKRWVSEYGIDQTKRIMKFDNSRSRLLLRVNTNKMSLKNFLLELDRQKIAWTKDYPALDSVELGSLGQPVSSIDGFASGLFLVQDLASQIIPDLLKVKPHHRVLDACAAPGNKTFHIASKLGSTGKVVACDVSSQRLAEARMNLERLGVQRALMVCGDCSDESFTRNLGSFDRILVDAPCSSLGVLRHNPEVKYILNEHDLRDQSVRQFRILQAVSNMLEPEGLLVYSVCSTSKEETVDVAHSFVSNNPDFVIDPIDPATVVCPVHVDDEGFLSTFPPDPDFLMDGFFAARFRRVDSRA